MKFSITTLVLLLTFFSSTMIAQNITSQTRELNVDAMARDAIFDEDDIIVSDSIDSILAGGFDEALGVAADTITGFTQADAAQVSNINDSSNRFEIFSEIETRSIEDGASANFARSFFQLQFTLPLGGRLELAELEVLATRVELASMFGDESRSDDAIATITLTETETLSNFVDESLILGRDDEVAELSADQELELPAGDYVFTVNAEITGDDGFNMVQGQPRGSNLMLSIDGQIIAFVPGDMNCDGFINLLDVQPFVDEFSMAIFSPKADINQDGSLNLLDVQPFVDALSSN